jgi:3-phosphoshikimate 1-carboxyvinyltransferase
LIFNAMAGGHATIENLLQSEDVHSTASCLEALGVHFEGRKIFGMNGSFTRPEQPLQCGNSGTTMRLLLGLLAGQRFEATLTGDQSLQSRPMGRVSDPLSQLGASFDGPDGGRTAPLSVIGGSIHNCEVTSSIASAQVKTALMLAALQGQGTLVYSEPVVSRDHSERMLRSMGLSFDDWIESDGTHFIRLQGGQALTARDVTVPGDISSAAFFMVAGSIVPGSDITLENVGLNPTRTGIVDALTAMGGNISIQNRHENSGEPVGDVRVRSAELEGTVIDGSIIPRLVDELPVLAVAAAMARGTTVVGDAAELRVKESDRIDASVSLVRGMGVQAESSPDGFVIEGGGPGIKAGFDVDANGDHRVAMSAVVAGLVTSGETHIAGVDSIATSFPDFLPLIESLRV